jgi:hypothetical protein
MGCHLGWHFPVGCPLRGGIGEYNKTIGTYVPPKTIKEKKYSVIWKVDVEEKKGKERKVDSE